MQLANITAVFHCTSMVHYCLLTLEMDTLGKDIVDWLSPRNFFRGQNLLLCKFLLLFYCFRTKFQGGAKVFKGVPLPTPLWEKARLKIVCP